MSQDEDVLDYKLDEMRLKFKLSNSVEICRDRRLCKICASCVNFPGNQRHVLHNLRRTTRFTHTKCDFVLKLLKFDLYQTPAIDTAGPKFTRPPVVTVATNLNSG